MQPTARADSPTTSADQGKPVDYDPAILFNYGITDYASLDLAEARAKREIATSRIRIETAKSTINNANSSSSLFKGTGGQEAISRANQEISNAYNTAVTAQKALAIIAAKRAEWDLIKNSSRLINLQNKKGSKIKAHVITFDDTTLTIATEAGKVFKLNWDVLDDTTRANVKGSVNHVKVATNTTPKTDELAPIKYPYVCPDIVNAKEVVDQYLYGNINLQALQYIMGANVSQFEDLYDFPTDYQTANTWQDALTKFYDLLPRLATNPWQKTYLRFSIQSKISDNQYVIIPKPKFGENDQTQDQAILNTVQTHYGATGDEVLPVVLVDTKEIVENSVRKTVKIYKEVDGGSNSDYLKLKAAQFDLRYWMRQSQTPLSEISKLKTDLISMTTDGAARYNIAKDDLKWILLCPAVIIVLHDAIYYSTPAAPKPATP